MPLRVQGASGIYTEIAAAASANNNQIVLPAGNGSAYQILRNGGTAGTTEFADKIVSGTAQNSTSGTSIDFTGIPAWAKRLTVMFSGVSTNGTSNMMIRLGTSGGIEATGYAGCSSQNGTVNSAQNDTTGVGIRVASSSATLHGSAVICLIGSNIWTVSYNFGRSDAADMVLGGFSKTLSGTLDRVRITTANGTDTFDAGIINILHE